LLINNGRFDDAQKASKDSAFYDKLHKEYKEAYQNKNISK
jgi:hypothetical protein